MGLPLLVQFATLFVGCTAATPFDTGGGRADGMITITATPNLFNPSVDWDAFEGTVLERCSAWGYTGLQAFGGVTQQCVAISLFGCNRYQFSRNYQCTD